MIIPVGYGQVSFFFSGAALPYGAACTLGFANVLDDDAQSIANTIAALTGTEDIMNNVSSDVTLASLHVKLGPTETGQAADAAIGDPGDDTDPSASPNSCYLIRKVTALGGRANRGRMYWPGLPQSVETAGGGVASGTLAVFQPKWDNFYDALVSNSLGPVVLHSTEATPTPIESFTIDSKAATQRRRLRR